LYTSDAQFELDSGILGCDKRHSWPNSNRKLRGNTRRLLDRNSAFMRILFAVTSKRAAKCD
jgi:hypothetical protein